MTRRDAMLLMAGHGLAARLIAAPVTLKVQVKGRVTTMALEPYVAATLAGESAVFQSKEALKAMAVAARSYAIHFRGRHASEGFDLCDTTHCQRLHPEAVNDRLSAAAKATEAELLWFEGKPALAAYTRDCGGNTADVDQVWPGERAPYLTNHTDPYCSRSAGNRWRWETTGGQLLQIIAASGLRAPKQIERIVIARQSRSGRAVELVLSGGGSDVRISASSLRFAVGRAVGFNSLASDRYRIGNNNGHFVFDGTGSGHGVGLCQNGAEQMGRAGRSYRDILGFYYPGTTVGATAGELSWNQIRGEHVVLLTMHPDADRVALLAADAAFQFAKLRVRRAAPASVEVRVYPDLERYRNITREPGWVAAHTESTVIHLQPSAVLQQKGALISTLRHEMLHVILEHQSKPGLPVWFREGLAGYLEIPETPISGNVPGILTDAGLRQIGDVARARQAYLSARTRVANLVERYSETEVLGWLTTGLPREITNASAKQPATKSK